MASRRAFMGWLAALVAAPKAIAEPLNVTDVAKGQLPTEIPYDGGYWTSHGDWRIPRSCASGDIRQGSFVGVDENGMVVPLTTRGMLAFGIAREVNAKEIVVRV
jgi:hypothetical protein